MCQIISLRTTRKKLKKIKRYPYISLAIQEMLFEKGGDYFSCGVMVRKEKFLIQNENNIQEILKEAYKFIKKMKSGKNETVQLLFFSRQQPEMEEKEVQQQPYFFNSISNKYDGFFAVHGTVYNDEELSKKYKVEIGADTEIFQYLEMKNWNEAQGTYAIIGITDTGYPVINSHGLEIWSNDIVEQGEHLASVFGTTSKVREFFKKPAIGLSGETTQNKKRILFASFSGGMDIGLSVYNALALGNYKKLILNYFAWGSRAEKTELERMEKFVDFYSSMFEVEVELKVWKAEVYFKEYFKMNAAQLPKIFNTGKDDKTGVSEETESPITYVPYRNTQFALLLASHAEALELQNVDILFGLNLSEGMVFMDNSEGWLESIEQVVKFGGKDFKLTGTYQVIAPYFPRTKTNMLKEFNELFGIKPLKHILDITTSCYYPKEDGSPCGECGSCILRRKAIKNIKGL